MMYRRLLFWAAPGAELATTACSPTRRRRDHQAKEHGGSSRVTAKVHHRRRRLAEADFPLRNESTPGMGGKSDTSIMSNVRWQLTKRFQLLTIRQHPCHHHNHHNHHNICITSNTVTKFCLSSSNYTNTTKQSILQLSISSSTPIDHHYSRSDFTGSPPSKGPGSHPATRTPLCRTLRPPSRENLISFRSTATNTLHHAWPTWAIRLLGTRLIRRPIFAQHQILI